MRSPKFVAQTGDRIGRRNNTVCHARGKIQDERSRRVELMLVRSAPAQTWFTSQCDDE